MPSSVAPTWRGVRSQIMEYGYSWTMVTDLNNNMNKKKNYINSKNIGRSIFTIIISEEVVIVDDDLRYKNKNKNKNYNYNKKYKNKNYN